MHKLREPGERVPIQRMARVFAVPTYSINVGVVNGRERGYVMVWGERQCKMVIAYLTG